MSGKKHHAGFVACLGPEGTFSHLLARKRFGNKTEVKVFPGLAAAFAEAMAHPQALVLAPIENSSGGTICDTVDLLIQNAGRLSVKEELLLDVRLALLGRRGEPIEVVFSHFAPLQHHARWLAKHCPGARLEPVTSTAQAAIQAANTPKSAALAARSAAELYGLEVLRYPIRPDVVNVTRFYLIEQRAPDPHQPPPRATMAKTAFTFRLKNECGSLHAFLGPFRKHKVNLRMIVSRPIPGHPETYVFFAEVEGALGEGKQSPVWRALRMAGRAAETLEHFGSFPAGRRYVS